MTLKEEITNLINEADICSTFFYGDVSPEECGYDDDDMNAFKQSLKDAGIVFEHVDQHGGEGEGDQYWNIYRFTKQDESVLVKFNGYYASYNGADYTDWFFVVPREVMVTQYFAE